MAVPSAVQVVGLTVSVGVVGQVEIVEDLSACARRPAEYVEATGLEEVKHVERSPVHRFVLGVTSRDPLIAGRNHRDGTCKELPQRERSNNECQGQ
jgi:hypothetical protein